MQTLLLLPKGPVVEVVVVVVVVVALLLLLLLLFLLVFPSSSQRKTLLVRCMTPRPQSVRKRRGMPPTAAMRPRAAATATTTLTSTEASSLFERAWTTQQQRAAASASARAAAAPMRASDALMLSLSLALSPSPRAEQGREKKRVLFFLSEWGRKTEKNQALGRESLKASKPLSHSLSLQKDSQSLPFYSFALSLAPRHARPPRVERTGLRAQRQEQQGAASCVDANDETTAAATDVLCRSQSHEGWHRSNKGEKKEEGDDSALAFIFVVFFVFFCVFRHGRGQRLCRRGDRNRNSSSNGGLDNDNDDDDGKVVDALALGPLAPGLQAQAREGRAVPVPHRREELHSGDGAR